ncbi:HAD family hydrolase [Methanothermobacter tenebrarum]|uniref:Cation transporter n=1 Tax=Methanothermobacter tenebrarum TaxID=680118 RepID=A0A328P8Y0_9EURY|nr:HAD family hydrolase [Methanothermobacter tenebrarum]MBC7100674.1 HAD family hydrolase [Methanobacteriales archaeon]MBC7117778.1 HAD family hydrolase [Methanobacteriaceae archaeon]NPV65357.1 HAD family hydrolase [Methanobacteriaceae archaeon]RAO78937.1 cation transporter [Methanothermobacter tenebrarum]
MKKAIVFDNSGTLTERYRAIKRIKTGKICDFISSLDLVEYKKNRALVVLQTDPAACIINARPNQTIYDFITRNNIDLGISYSNIDISKDEILDILKDDNSKVKDIQDTIRAVLDRGYDIEICSGSGFILNIEKRMVEFTITAGGRLFPEVLDVISELKKRDMDIYVASGDRKGALEKLAITINIPTSNVFATVDAKGKALVIRRLKKKYDKVMMVGDGLNDILALKEADIGVLTLQQSNNVHEKLLKAADIIIYNIREILDIKF